MLHQNGIVRLLGHGAAAFLLISGFWACNNMESTTAEDDQVDTTSLEALYWERVADSRMNFTEADVLFMTDMIIHHAQALIMSDLAPENDAGVEVQRLAARIINAQNDEISTMQQWLRDRGQPVPDINIHGLHLMVGGLGDHHNHSDHSDMPGMLSQKQLEELAAARNTEFDRLFLKYMIEHHEGAVIMVNQLFGTDGAAQDLEAFRLASDIHVDQITEIDRMKYMLNNMAAP